MECPNCQNTIPDTAQFCAYCGATINVSPPGSGSSRRRLFIGAAAVVAVIAIALVAFLMRDGARAGTVWTDRRQLRPRDA